MTAPATDTDRLLVSGTLASRRRTVAGLLGQLGLAGVADAEIPGLLRRVGLPSRAAEDPDFPVSLAQELRVLALMLERLVRARRTPAGFAAATFSHIGINHYGVLGLAMQHAPSVLRSLEVMLAYPELCWGHSRVSMAQRGNAVVLAFDFDAPQGMAMETALREYCVTTDLVSVERLIGDVIGRSVLPEAIALPFAAPADGLDADVLPCPVQFGAPSAEIRYSLNLLTAPVLHAGALPFRRYDKVARAFSRMLADDVAIDEQVMRLLWAYEPTPSREAVADMLSMGVRTLSRRLQAAGTSYQALLQRVHGERAMNYLRHTQSSIGEIAEAMGYADAAAFSRAFRGWTGQAPSRWRAARQS